MYQQQHKQQQARAAQVQRINQAMFFFAFGFVWLGIAIGGTIFTWPILGPFFVIIWIVCGILLVMESLKRFLKRDTFAEWEVEWEAEHPGMYHRGYHHDTSPMGEDSALQADPYPSFEPYVAGYTPLIKE